MFGSGNFWDKSPVSFLKILKLLSFYSSNFKIFKYELGQFTPSNSPKHVITSTYATVLLQIVTVITKCVNFITKCDSYYKMLPFLQNVLVQVRNQILVHRFSYSKDSNNSVVENKQLSN